MKQILAKLTLGHLRIFGLIVGGALVALLYSCGGGLSGNYLRQDPGQAEPGQFKLVTESVTGELRLNLVLRDNSDVLEVEIHAQAAKEVSAVLLHLEFDPLLFSPKQVNIGSFLGSEAEVISLYLTDIAGEVPLGIIQLPTTAVEPGSGNGLLATVVFWKQPAQATRRTSASPSGPVNKVTDLRITAQSATAATLEWTQLNIGDYNNDSEVGLADITQIVLLYGQLVDIAADPVWAAMVDGDQNGEINLADITPIVVNFGNTCDGYVVYKDQTATSPYTTGITADRDDFFVDKKKPVAYVFEADFKLDGTTVFTVKPVAADDLNNPGPASNQVTPELADILEFDPPGQAFSGMISVSLTGVDLENVRYTTDDTLPTSLSTIYFGPLELTETTWLRAGVFVDGQLEGEVISQAYIAVDAEVAGFTSNLPLILIDTFGYDINSESDPWLPRPFRPVLSMFIDNPDFGRTSTLGQPDYSGYSGMHVRGSSSSGFPKKQYRFETWGEDGKDVNQALLGMPPESDWIIQGPFSDKTLMRNALVYMWSNAIGQYAPRVRFVEAFINFDGGITTYEDYVGVYLLLESVKRDPERVSIAKLNDTVNSEPEISGGYILKQDRVDDDPSNYFFSETYGNRLVYVYPKPEDLNQAQRDWIKGYVDEFETVLSGPGFADPLNGYAKYIDVPSFIDHLLLTEMARNVDGYRLSTYMYKDLGGKLSMGPAWDFNLALCNADYFHAFEVEGWQFAVPEFLADNPPFLAWYYRLLEDPAFVAQIEGRWHELRSGRFATNQLLLDIEANAALLDEAQGRNFLRWPILGQYVWPNQFVGNTYREDVDFMKGWLAGRLAWMDGELL